MKSGRSGFPLVALVVGMLGCGPTGLAVVLPPADDPERHTRAPEGDLGGSGWQWQGNWGGFCGTPVSRSLFLTARHVGGSVGQSFTLNGEAYRTVARLIDPDPKSDLVLWKVCGAFPDWAPLAGGDGPSAGDRCVVFGRGLARGGEVTVTNEGEAVLRGWTWGANDGRLRWGLNTISTNGSLYLEATFDAASGSDEAMLAGGDSGGGLFVQQDGEWRLAGIHYAVDGPFRYGEGSPAFMAALFDRRGLEEQQQDGSWKGFLAEAGPRPVAFYSTSVLARRAWIESVLAAPATPEWPTVESAPTPGGPFAVVVDVTPVEGREAFRLSGQPPTGFFRLNSCLATEILQLLAVDGGMELRWRWLE